MYSTVKRTYSFKNTDMKTIESLQYISIHDIHEPGSTPEHTLLFVYNLLSIIRVQETCDLNKSCIVKVHLGFVSISNSQSDTHAV